jgi:hypothetical protein
MDSNLRENRKEQFNKERSILEWRYSVIGQIMDWGFAKGKYLGSERE